MGSLGRAGHSPDILAVAVTYVESKHLLPEEIKEGDFVGYTDSVRLGDDENRQKIRAFVQSLYKGGPEQQSARVKVSSAYHKLGPGILWYINTRGCQCRATMAAFIDATTYHGIRPDTCCDNRIFGEHQDNTTSSFLRNRVDIKQSI